MLIKSSNLPTYLEDITNIENSNIHIFVKLKNVYTQTVVAVAAKNIESLMYKKKMNHFEPGYPLIIVRKLTKEIIT